jgi:hypothetical protein
VRSDDLTSQSGKSPGWWEESIALELGTRCCKVDTMMSVTGCKVMDCHSKSGRAGQMENVDRNGTRTLAAIVPSSWNISSYSVEVML